MLTTAVRQGDVAAQQSDFFTRVEPPVRLTATARAELKKCDWCHNELPCYWLCGQSAAVGELCFRMYVSGRN